MFSVVRCRSTNQTPPQKKQTQGGGFVCYACVDVSCLSERQPERVERTLPTSRVSKKEHPCHMSGYQWCLGRLPDEKFGSWPHESRCPPKAYSKHDTHTVLIDPCQRGEAPLVIPAPHPRPYCPRLQYSWGFRPRRRVAIVVDAPPAGFSEDLCRYRYQFDNRVELTATWDVADGIGLMGQVSVTSVQQASGSGSGGTGDEEDGSGKLQISVFLTASSR